MIEYRLGQAAQLLGVSVDTVRRWADSGRLPTRRTPGGQRLVQGGALAELAVALAGEAAGVHGADESARNHFPGLVTRVIKDTVMAQVDIQAGRHRVVSLMSREAADELGLVPGMLAVAVVKATTVVVQLPPSGRSGAPQREGRESEPPTPSGRRRPARAATPGRDGV